MQTFSISKNYQELLKINIDEINWFPSVAMMLTKACALKCEFCCEPDIRTKEKFEFQYKEIIEKLYDYGTKRLCLAGGEPLLYKNLLTLIENSKQKDFYNLLLTADGVLLFKKIKDIISNIDGFRLSIQGIGIKHDNFVKSKNSFNNLLKSIDLIKLHNKDLMVSTVVTNDNIYSLHEMVDWAKRKGFQKYYLYGLLYSGDGYDFIRKYGRPDRVIFDKIILELRNEFEDENFKISCYDYNENGECILVYGNGDVFVAPYFGSDNYRLKIGNLLSDGKDVIWSNFISDSSNYTGHKKHLKNAI